EAVLRPEFPVDEVEHVAELADVVREIDRSSGGIGNGFKSVLAGRVASAFRFYCPHDDGVKESIGAKSGAPRGLKISPAGRLSCVRDQHYHPPPPCGISR